MLFAPVLASVLNEEHCDLVNIVFIVAKLENICLGRKSCVW